MAYLNQTLAGTGIADRLSVLLAALKGSIQRRRIYNLTVSELSALSTRELDDLGINRTMIRRLAWETANGK